MVTDRIYSRCNQAGTVTSELAKDPSQCPGKIFKELYETHDHTLHPKSSIDGVDSSSDEVSSALEKEKLQKASSCGNWAASAPSELFLKVKIHRPLSNFKA